MESDIVADMVVDKVADKVADMVADVEVDKVADKKIDININMEIQFRERMGHGGWLIGPKLFRPKGRPKKSGKWQKSLLKKGKESYVMRFQLIFSFSF